MRIPKLSSVVPFFLLVLLEKSEAVIYSSSNNVKNFVNSYNHLQSDYIHKVSFTQKGYIQFLRYISDVPTLNEYTFCIWMRSSNLTHSHPLLSYSIHEHERLIRAWISPYGTHINLEILNVPIFKIPTQFVEHHWYHVCQSWSSQRASWNLYLNGKLKSSGIEPKLRGVKIKGGGDIVVGQEYTDFDKGLDDGIEGDVFGFNFVLSASTYSGKPDLSSRRHYFSHVEGAERKPLIYSPASEVPTALGYFTHAGRKSKGFLEYFDNVFSFLDEPTVRTPLHNRRIINDLDEYIPKSTGSKLVELSFNCFLGKGSPVSGKEVLISWTRTPVRVFGGAILKTAPPFCT